MSVTFSVTGVPDRDLNLSQLNAIDLLRWLGFELRGMEDLYGSMSVTEMAARCRRRLWDVPRNYDPELPGSCESSGGARLLFAGRPAGYLRRRTTELLELLEAAPEAAEVRWS